MYVGSVEFPSDGGPAILNDAGTRRLSVKFGDARRRRPLHLRLARGRVSGQSGRDSRRMAEATTFIAFLRSALEGIRERWSGCRRGVL